MTRQDQNAIIINSLASKLIDVPNVQAVISRAFDAWFRNLVKAAATAIAPVPAEGDQQQQQGGAEGAPA